MRRQSNAGPTRRVRSRPSLTFAALALLAGAAAPLAAQSTYRMNDDGQVMVQNNRTVPVTVYLQHDPLELKLGEVAAMQTATLAIPHWAVREQDHLDLMVQPEGQIALAGSAMISDHGPRFALVVPGKGETLKAPHATLAAMLPSQDLDAATVTIRNDRKRDADVYIQHGGIDVRLGRALAHSVTTFRVPDGWVGETGQVLVVPRKGNPLASQDVQLDEGMHLGVHVE